MPSTPLSPNVPISLAAGATLALRTAQTIDSASSRVGQTFAAVVSRDINNTSEQTVLPSGSPATLVLLRGQNDKTLELGIDSVTLNGDAYLVRNDRAGPAVSGARLGTFLGGVSGTQQPPGETRRALSVAGETIWVPEGSLLTFRLDQSLLLIGSHTVSE